VDDKRERETLIVLSRLYAVDSSHNLRTRLSIRVVRIREYKAMNVSVRVDCDEVTCKHYRQGSHEALQYASQKMYATKTRL